MTDLLVLLLAAGAGSLIAIALVLAIRGGLRRLFGPTLAYGAWIMVPAVILAILVPARDDLSRMIPGVHHLLAYAGTVLATLVISVSGWTAALVGTWCGGMLLTAVVLYFAQVRFQRSLGTLTQRNGLWYAQRDDVSPGVVGCLRPMIVVPADFDSRYTPDEQALILAHERTHIRRGDLIANAVWSAIQCLLWFNPLAHLATSRYRFDQELACDATTLKNRSRFRRTYAAALLKTLSLETTLPLGSSWQAIHPLKGRILSLQVRAMTPGRLGIGYALVVIVSTGLALGAWDVRPANAYHANAAARAHAAHLGIATVCPVPSNKSRSTST
jgi:bla regulator protein BlaR1